MQILVVEDDPILARSVAETVGQMGHAAVVARSGTEAADLIASERFDLAILDIGLPGINGISLLQQIRRESRTMPVILMTARDTLDDRIRGLHQGADDYLVKPVVMRELAARIRARMRIAHLESSQRLELGPLTVDVLARRASSGGREIELTPREWLLLEHLMRRVGQIVTKDDIQSLLVGRDEAGYNASEVYVSRLRAKIEPLGLHIRTIRGLGYRLDERVGDPRPAQARRQGGGGEA